ncbi:hypothetical protein [Sporosarcina sp. ACRSL]|uniref:hypothetical protein n=1 Tax=Sporosarcina sp. ACRSL TaxID=2918215 RepID=UPI001EF53BFE|nr:hypothetical protein [Sporosarcina sp. ACRSL]
MKTKLIEAMFQYAKSEVINYSVEEGALSFVTYLYYFDGHSVGVALCIGLEEEVKELERQWGSDVQRGYYNYDFKYTKAFGDKETVDQFDKYMDIVIEKSKEDPEYSSLELNSLLNEVSFKLKEVEWEGLIRNGKDFTVSDFLVYD